MTISERAAYVKGLVAGLSIDGNSPEGKAINALVELCDELAAEIKHISLRAGALEQSLEDVNDYVDAIDSDLFTVEESLNLNDSLEEFDDDLDDLDDLDDDYDYDDESDAIYQVTCPKCGTECLFSEDDIIGEDGVICPECGEVIKWDIGEETEEEESED